MLHFPPYRLDTENECLWQAAEDGSDQRITLRPKAFAVLRYLLERPGRVIAEGELLEAVWSGVVVQPEVLKSQIYDIRRQLKDSPKVPRYIETVPRRGYRFLAAVSDKTSLPEAHAAPGEPNVVGRASCLAELRSHLRAACSGRRGIVLISGEPGIGKTTLVDAFQHEATSGMRSLQIARGQCIEGYGGHEPYYPVLEALDQLCRAPGGASVVSILAAEAPTWLMQFPSLMTRKNRDSLRRETLGATSERMLREIGAALEAIAAVRPLLLVLEDLQWVDPSTVDLLSAIARRRTAAKLLVVATLRPVHAVPLAQLKQELVPRQLMQEIDLPPLSPQDVAEYLAATSPSSAIPGGLAELIYRLSEGNPLFMVAVLDNLQRRGLLTRIAGQWVISVPLQEIGLGVPEGLREMIEAQVGRLSAQEQRVLQAASVSGMVFSATVAAASLGQEPEAIEELLDALARRVRLVRATGSVTFPDGSICQRFEFAHALYREVIYHQQSRLRCANLHRRIGEFIERLFAQQLDQVASELAHHFDACGDWSRVVRYLRLAAERALHRYAHPQAGELLRKALAASEELPAAERQAEGVALLEQLAATYAATYDPRAVDTYTQMAERAAATGGVDTLIRAHLGAAFPLSCISSERCLEVLDKALELTARLSDPVLRARRRATVYDNRLMTRGWNSADRKAFLAAFSQIESAADPPARAYHMIENGELLWASAQYREAHRTLTEGFQILFGDAEAGRGSALSLHHWAYRLQIVWASLFAGEWGQALREAREGIAIMERNADHYCAQTMRLYQAWIHLFACDFTGAQALCETTFDTGVPVRSSQTPALLAPLAAELRIALILMGSAQVGLGHFEWAQEYLSRAHEDLERQQLILGWYWRMPLELARAELAMAQARWPEARASAERFHAAAQATAEGTWQALAWRTKAQVALVERELTSARGFIEEGLRLVRTKDLPLAAWRVFEVAAEVADAAGDESVACHHREAARALVLELAKSLPRDEPLHQVFLSAPPVTTLLGANRDPERLIQVPAR